MDREHENNEAGAGFGPESGYESDSSVSDKAFFQAEAVNPVAEQSTAGERKKPLNNGADREEFAAEVAPLGGTQAGTLGDAGRASAKRGGTLGYAAIITAALAMFLLPQVLGPAAVVVGFMAFVRGSRALGIWSIVLGIVAFVSFLTTVSYPY